MATSEQGSGGDAAEKSAAPPQLTIIDDPLEVLLGRMLEEIERGRWGFMVGAIRETLQKVKKKEKLAMVSDVDEFRDALGSASPSEVQALADCGLFKMLCANLKAQSRESVAHTAECLSHCIKIVPELCVRAWEFGAVREVTGIIMRINKVTNKRALAQDIALQRALYFLETMGRPLKGAPCSEHAKTISKKFYHWAIRQGLMEKVAEIWVALSSIEQRDRDPQFVPTVYHGATVLMFGTYFAPKGRAVKLEEQSGLLGAVMHFLQLKHQKKLTDYSYLTVEVSMCLLLNVWLLRSAQSEAVRRGKQELAEHADTLKVVKILHDFAEAQSEPVPAISEESFARLVCFLTFEHPRPLPAPTVASAVRIMIKRSVEPTWQDCKALMAHHFHAGHVSIDFLLTHFYPGFLAAFIGEAERSAPARVFTPELDPLVSMLSVLSESLWFSHPPDEPEKTLEMKNKKAGIVVAAKYLPVFLKLMIESRAAAAVASLTRSAFYYTAIHVCMRLAHVAACHSSADLQRLNEQIIPVLVRNMFDGLKDDEVMRVGRSGLPGYLTNGLVAGMQPFRIECPLEIARNRGTARYNWNRNCMEFSEEIWVEKQHVLTQLVSDMQMKGGAIGPDDMEKDEFKRMRLYYKHPVIYNGTNQAAAQEAIVAEYPGERCSSCTILLDDVKRCSRCHARNYCSVTCQKKEWPEHKKSCQKK